MAYAQRGELIEMAQQLQRELIATCVSNYRIPHSLSLLILSLSPLKVTSNPGS